MLPGQSYVGGTTTAVMGNPGMTMAQPQVMSYAAPPGVTRPPPTTAYANPTYAQGAMYTQGVPPSYVPSAPPSYVPAAAPMGMAAAPPSYVPAAAPVAMAPMMVPPVMPTAAPKPLPTQAPQKPTRKSDTMADPASIEQQKKEYARVLDVELQQGISVTQQRVLEHKQQLAQQAEKAKQQYQLILEQDLLQKGLAWDKQTEQQILQLHEAYNKQMTHLEQQSSKLSLDYTQKKMQEELEMKKYNLQFNSYQARLEAQRKATALAQQISAHG